MIDYRSADSRDAMMNSIVIPPMQFESSGDKSSVPTVAPPDGYFVLEVRNEGLPSGYAAKTKILVGKSLPREISVPFKGTYYLPVNGYDPDVTVAVPYEFILDQTVSTTSGIYKSAQDNFSIVPRSGDLYTVDLKWQSEDSIEMRSPSVITTELPRNKTIDLVSDTTDSLVQPTFHPSTDRQSVPPLPPLPSSYVLTQPHIDPPNTFRAESIQQMFKFTVTPESRRVVYYVGKTVFETVVGTYTLKNKTINTPLRFQFDMPSFLRINVPVVLTIQPRQTINIDVLFNEDDVKQKSIEGIKLISTPLRWIVDPLSVSGPVYVELSDNTTPSEVIQNPDVVDAPRLSERDNI